MCLIYYADRIVQQSRGVSISSFDRKRRVQRSTGTLSLCGDEGGEGGLYLYDSVTGTDREGWLGGSGARAKLKRDAERTERLATKQKSRG